MADTETRTERTSDTEIVVTRTVRGPAAHVFAAWARPELFRQWWVPPSFPMTIVDYDADVRTGGTYRLALAHPAADGPMTFHGRYLEVVPDARIVWTNDEGEDEGPVTTVTFDDRDGTTLVTVRDVYPSKAALDEAIEQGSTSGWPEQLGQLDALVAGSAG